jgi:hypothetical protein
MPDEPRDATSRKRASGAQPGNSNALKHGAYRKRRALKEIDWSTQLDRRTSLYRELRERAERIVGGAGGPTVVPPNRLALAPHAAQVELELECLNQAIRELGPIDRRRKTARRLVEDRNRLLRTYRETLEVIGWDRPPVERSPPAEVIAKYAEKRPALPADGVGDPMGTPRLDRAAGSVPRESRRDSENPPVGAGHPPRPPSPPAADDTAEPDADE